MQEIRPPETFRYYIVKNLKTLYYLFATLTLISTTNGDETFSQLLDLKGFLDPSDME